MFFKSSKILTHSIVEDLEYSDCILGWEVNPVLKGVLGMTLNFIWKRGSSFGAVRSMEFPYNAKSTLTLNGINSLFTMHVSNRSV